MEATITVAQMYDQTACIMHPNHRASISALQQFLKPGGRLPRFAIQHRFIEDNSHVGLKTRAGEALLYDALPLIGHPFV